MRGSTPIVFKMAMLILLVAVGAAGPSLSSQPFWAAGRTVVPDTANSARIRGAFREVQGGWTFIHIHGEPADWGLQYGTLMASEIDGFMAFMKVYLQHETGKDWSFFRNKAKDWFLPKLEPEFGWQAAYIKKLVNHPWSLLMSKDKPYLGVLSHVLPCTSSLTGWTRTDASGPSQGTRWKQKAPMKPKRPGSASS